MGGVPRYFSKVSGSRVDSTVLRFSLPLFFRTCSEGCKWGVRSVVVEFGDFGAPRFSVQRSPNYYFKGFRGFMPCQRAANGGSDPSWLSTCIWRFWGAPIFRPEVPKTRGRKMNTNFFGTNFLSTPRGPGHPGKNPGTSQVPPFETQVRQTFEGGHEVFDPYPFAWKTPTPPGSLRTQTVNLCALFSCLKNP